MGRYDSELRIQFTTSVSHQVGLAIFIPSVRLFALGDGEIREVTWSWLDLGNDRSRTNFRSNPWFKIRQGLQNQFFESGRSVEGGILSDLLVAVFATVIITAILTTLLNLFYQRLSARKPRQAKTPSPVLVEKTYLVRGIPDKYTMTSAESLVESILDKCKIDSHIKAYSLAYDPLEKSAKVATFTMRGDPKHLCHPFQIPEKRLPDANKKLGQFKIFVDDHFEGFNPLNTIETRDHTIELVHISC